MKKASQVLDEANVLSLLVHEARHLQDEPVHVHEHVVGAQHGASPLAAVERDLPGNVVVRGTLLLEAEKVLEQAPPVDVADVHGHKVLPGHEAAVVPLVVDGRLHRQRVALQNGAVAPAVARAVQIRLVLVLERLGAGDDGLDVVVGARVGARRAVALKPRNGRVAAQVDKGRVGNVRDPVPKGSRSGAAL